MVRDVDNTSSGNVWIKNADRNTDTHFEYDEWFVFVGE
jgi:hypothetical protein